MQSDRLRMMMAVGSLSLMDTPESGTQIRLVPIDPDDDLHQELRPSASPRRGAKTDREKQPGWNKPNVLKKFRKRAKDPDHV